MTTLQGAERVWGMIAMKALSRAAHDVRAIVGQPAMVPGALLRESGEKVVAAARLTATGHRAAQLSGLGSTRTGMLLLENLDNTSIAMARTGGRLESAAVFGKNSDMLPLLDMEVVGLHTDLWHLREARTQLVQALRYGITPQ